jgi:drug/metabolite transporter (DMT)-like permease
MSNTGLYLLTVLIWGSTWVAIKYQLGVVSPLVSIGHRFLLAAALIFIYLLLRRQLQKMSPAGHLLVFFQGLCLFCINYVFIYTATAQLTSGLVAVVFSTMVFFNIVNGTLFLGLPASPIVALGGGVGVIGMVGVFLPELQALDLSDDNFRALLLCLAGTFSASLGNILAARNQRSGLGVLTTNAWGMLYGALTLYTAALLRGQSLAFDPSASYLLSLSYLAVFGSVVAFWAYVTLIGRIGADRASYTSLLFPVVALVISTVLEGYTWTWPAFGGLCLVLLGNWIVMRRGRV